MFGTQGMTEGIIPRRQRRSTSQMHQLTHSKRFVVQMFDLFKRGEAKALLADGS